MGKPGESTFVLFELAIFDDEQNRIDVIGATTLLIEFERAAIALVEREIRHGLQRLLYAFTGRFGLVGGIG